MMNVCLKNEFSEVKTVKALDLAEKINAMGNVLIIRYGNFAADTCKNKFLFDFKVQEEDGRIIIKGKSFDDFEEEVEESFVIDENDVFDAYYSDDGYEKKLHINLFEMGEYVYIQEEL